MPDEFKRLFRNKHYFAIAHVILQASLECKTPSDHATLQAVAQKFVEAFEKELPSFRPQRFFNLCGINSNIAPLAPKKVL